MVSLTISNLAMVNFVIIISFMFILAIIHLSIIGLAIKYLFISEFSHIYFIRG